MESRMHSKNQGIFPLCVAFGRIAELQCLSPSASLKFNLRRTGNRHSIYRFFALRGQVRLAESLLEIISALKISPAVLLGFCQPPDIYHVENNIAEILAIMNPPFFQQGDRHGA